MWNRRLNRALEIARNTSSSKKYWDMSGFWVVVYGRFYLMNINPSNSFIVRWSLCFSLRNTPPKRGGGGGGVVVYQYTRKKFPKIPKNTQNSSKYTQNYTKVYFIPEIQRKWYTEYPYLSCNIPYTRFKKPLYTVYPQTLADPEVS